MASTAFCECDAEEHTAEDIITSCPIYRHPNGIRGLLTVNESLASCLIRAQPFKMMLLRDATSHPHKEEEVAEESAINDDCPHVMNSSLIRLFNVPTLNLKAHAYYELAYSDYSNNFQQLQTRQQPPAIV